MSPRRGPRSGSTAGGPARRKSAPPERTREAPRAAIREDDHLEETPIDPEIVAPGGPGDDLPPELIEANKVAESVEFLPPALPPEKGLTVPYDPLTRYIQEIRRFPSLSREEEVRLARLHRDHRDPEATRRLVTAHLMLVVKLALMYRRAIRNAMDLIQEGNIGLLEALKRYDPEQGVRFPTYAAWWIKAYMLKFLLDNARMVRVGTTNARRKLLYNLRRERDKLLAQGVAPTPKLLAEHFGVAESDVIEVEEAISGGDISVDAPVTEDGSATVGDVLAAPLPTAEETVSQQEIRERVAAAIAEFREELGERDRILLDLRLTADEPATLQEIGDRFGVTREAVRQSENRLKERLALHLRARLGEDFILRFTGKR